MEIGDIKIQERECILLANIEISLKIAEKSLC
jgi:hypothetical protein